MHPTIDCRIPKRNNCYFDRIQVCFFFVVTSVLIDKRLFKSCIRYSGDGGVGGGNDGLKKMISIEENLFCFFHLPKLSHMLWTNQKNIK
jgi:hypothetical protein